MQSRKKRYNETHPSIEATKEEDVVELSHKRSTGAMTTRRIGMISGHRHQASSNLSIGLKRNPLNPKQKEIFLPSGKKNKRKP